LPRFTEVGGLFSDFLKRVIFLKEISIQMIKVDLTSGGTDSEKDERTYLYVDRESVRICRVLKLATGLNFMDMVNTSLKITGVLSSTLSREDWRRISEANDLQEIRRILQSKNT